MTTRIIRVNGVPVRVPDALFMLPNAGARLCEAVEPAWPDGSGGEVVCCLAPHATGPAGLAHIADNANWPSGDIIAIWWDAPAVADSDDE